MLKKIISGSLLVAGTTVGAGMLGIPLLTAKAGFWPGALIIVFCWALLLWTGLLFLEATLWVPRGNHWLSITKTFLGQKGSIFSGVMFLFLYYCLLVAYFAAGAPMLGMGIGISGIWSYVLFGLIFGLIVGLGPKWIDRANILLILGLIVTYFLVVTLGSHAVEEKKLAYFDWSKAPFAMPILFSAFGYHNIIPSLVTYFGKEKKAVRLSLIFGTTMALVIYLIWQWLILGIIPKEQILTVLGEGKPVTAALENITGSRAIFLSGQFFAFFALITSLLGISFSMVDFLADGFKVKREGKMRAVLTFLIFFPPFVFSLLYPTIFERALGLAGGIGEAVLNGLIPIAVIWVGCFHKKLKTDMHTNRFLLGLGACVILIVIGLEIVDLFSARI